MDCYTLVNSIYSNSCYFLVSFCSFLCLLFSLRAALLQALHAKVTRWRSFEPIVLDLGFECCLMSLLLTKLQEHFSTALQHTNIVGSRELSFKRPLKKQIVTIGQAVTSIVGFQTNNCWFSNQQFLKHAFNSNYKLLKFHCVIVLRITII